MCYGTSLSFQCVLIVIKYWSAEEEIRYVEREQGPPLAGTHAGGLVDSVTGFSMISHELLDFDKC